MFDFTSFYTQTEYTTEINRFTRYGIKDRKFIGWLSNLWFS